MKQRVGELLVAEMARFRSSCQNHKELLSARIRAILSKLPAVHGKQFSPTALWCTCWLLRTRILELLKSFAKVDR